MNVKSTLIALALSAGLAAPAFAAEPQKPATLPQFSTVDAQKLFEQDAKPAQLAALTQKEMKETEGAFWWYGYSYSYNYSWWGSYNRGGYFRYW